MLAARRAAEEAGLFANLRGDDANDTQASDAEIGAFTLGATTPDIRVITRWERERTHFFDLDNEQHQDSVAEFLRVHPQLRDAAALRPETRAWAGGFIAHLVMDATYIEEIYRPHFGQRSALGGGERANLLDRILQYEMDRREREHPDTMVGLRAALYGSAIDVDCGFIDRATLEQWRDVSASLTEHAPDWERFTYIASRHLKRAGVTTDAEYQAFLQQIPELLDETLRSVGAAKVEAFFEIAQQRTVVALREYLG
jgi:hypothetical protein